MVSVGYTIAPADSQLFAAREVKVPMGWHAYDLEYKNGVLVYTDEMEQWIRNRTAAVGSVSYYMDKVPETFITGTVILNDAPVGEAKSIQIGTRPYNGQAYVKRGTRASIRFMTPDDANPVRVTIYKIDEANDKLITAQDFTTTGNILVDGLVK